MKKKRKLAVNLNNIEQKKRVENGYFFKEMSKDQRIELHCFVFNE